MISWPVVLTATLLLAGCTTNAVVSTETPPAVRSSTPSAAPSPPITTVLAGLLTKGRAPKTGYARDRFGPEWTDDNQDPLGHNGCDTRNDILRRDLRQVTLKPDTHGCLVLSGVLDDPYTGATIRFVRGVGSSNAVQVDHVVALSDAWQKGAQQWTDDRRRDFANDPLELLAVDGPSNEAKGDGDAATWLPPNKTYRCSYVTRQIEIKAKYRLWVTAAERGAMATILDSCG